MCGTMHRISFTGPPVNEPMPPVPKKLGRPLSLDDGLVAELYGAGHSGKTIAEVLGVCPQTVYSSLERSGVARSYRGAGPKGRKASRNSALAKEYLSGLTMRELAKCHGITVQRVQQILSRDGVDPRPVGVAGYPIRACRECQAMEQLRRGLCRRCRGPKCEQCGVSLPAWGVRYCATCKPHMCRGKWVDWEDAKRRYEAGEGYWAIGRSLGFPGTTIHRRLVRMGVESRASGTYKRKPGRVERILSDGHWHSSSEMLAAGLANPSHNVHHLRHRRGLRIESRRVHGNGRGEYRLLLNRG